MVHNFIDREGELKFLKEIFSEKKPQLIIIYGRRRIGKTYLIQHFNKQSNIYKHYYNNDYYSYVC